MGGTLGKSITCAAIIAIRNELPHIERVLKSFINQKIDVVVIDQESTDGSLEVCKKYLGKGVVSLIQVPWNGMFDLTEQLTIKESVIRSLHHDWVIHADADEWLQSPVSGESLKEGIKRIDVSGYNVINFDEFVFLPVPNEYRNASEYHKKYLYYYYFSPRKNRLMRAWRRDSNINNIETGGHALAGEGINICPESFILRHYIVLSQSHAIEKYSSRIFSDIDIEKGWHGNRLNLSEKRLKLPDFKDLKKLSSWGECGFDKTDPKKAHYWDW